MEQYFELAGIRIRVDADTDLSRNPGILENYFAAAGETAHSYTTRITEQLGAPTGVRIFSDPAFCVYQDGDALIRYEGDASFSDHAYIRICRRGSHSDVQYRRAALYEGITARLLLAAVELEHLAAAHRGFLLHASCIGYRGQAILFTAPSETGKSTQAQLWCDHLGAELINGDRAAVRIFPDGVKICGIPYSGSSPVRKNVTLPLAAIVYLSQAPENTIERLEGFRAFRRIWEGCGVHTWSREDVEQTTRTVTEVIGRVPVYHLACTPDVRAAELLHRTMEVEK